MFCLRHLRYVTMKDYPILLLVWVCNSIDTYSIEDDSFEIKLNLFIHFGAIFWWFMHLRDMGIPWGERSKERRWTMFVLIENFYAIYRLLSCQKIYCSCWYVSWNISSFFVLVFTWMYNYWNEWNYYFHYKGTFYLTVLDAQTLFLIIAQAVSIIWFFLRKWLRVYWEHIFVNFRTSRVTALYIMNILTCIRKTAEW